MSIHSSGSIALTVIMAVLLRYPAIDAAKNVQTGNCFILKQYEAVFTDKYISDHLMVNQVNNEKEDALTYELKYGQCREKQNELKDFLILLFLRDYIAEAIKDYYGGYKPYMNEFITGIEKLGGEYRIGVRLETFTGAHNPPYGIDTMTVIKDFMGIRVENFEHDEVPPWNLYTHDKYHISLKYPAHWTKDHRYGERYSGADGYFFIAPVAGGVYLKPDRIEDVVRDVLKHKIHIYGISQFGEHPNIVSLKIRNQDARLITTAPATGLTPWQDKRNTAKPQTAEPQTPRPQATESQTPKPSENMSNQSILVIKCPGPFEVNERIYHYLILVADSEHIMKIAKTARFLY